VYVRARAHARTHLAWLEQWHVTVTVTDCPAWPLGWFSILNLNMFALTSTQMLRRGVHFLFNILPNIKLKNMLNSII